MDTEVLKSVLHTFFKVFPYGAVFSDLGDEELIMIGSMQPIQFNMNKLRSLFKSSRIQRQMKGDFSDEFDFLATFSLGRDEVIQLTKGAQLNTDINAFAEVRQSQMFYSFVEDPPGQFLANNYKAKLGSIVGSEVAASRSFQESLLESLKRFPGEAGGYQKFYAALSAYKKNFPEGPDNHFRLGLYHYYLEMHSSAKENLVRAIGTKPSLETLNLLLRVLLAAEDYSSAVDYYTKYRALKNKESDCYGLEALTYTGNIQKASALARDMMANFENHYSFCGTQVNRALGTFNFYYGSGASAAKFLQQHYDEDPNDIRSLELLISSYFSEGNRYSGSYYSSAYQQLYVSEKARLEGLKVFFENSSHNRDAELVSQRLMKFEN